MKRGSRRRTVIVLAMAIPAVVALAIMAELGVLLAQGRISVDTRTEWAIGIYTGASIGTLAPTPDAINPVIRAEDVTDVHATFVADPFMIYADSLWYMFFEVMSATSGHGEIGLAVSSDGLAWRYEAVVLDEPFHLSFPYVLKWEDAFYMVPECATAAEVRLYRATDFPRRWECVSVIAQGRLADSGLLHHRGTWWLFTCGAPWTHDTLRLFSSSSLTGPYEEHPSSPLIAGDGHRARLAGRLVVVDGMPIRFAQDSWPTYGKQVRVFGIDRIDQAGFSERPLETQKQISATGKGWNRHGMHHVDPHRLDTGMWIACVDGYRKYLTVRFEY